MFKKLLSLTFLFVVFLLSCRKDPPLYLTPIIEEPKSGFMLQNDVFPNPCRGIFTIKTNTTDSQSVNLFDVTGREMLNLTINGTTAIVDKSLVNGVYYLRISSKYGTNMKKIIVSK